MAVQREKFQTGNHVRVYIRGESNDLDLLGIGQVGGGPLVEGTSLDMRQDTGARHVHTMGSAEPVDIVDGPHTYSVTLAMLRLRDAKAARAVEAGRVTIEEVDRYTNRVVQVAHDCQLGSHGMTASANQLIARNVTFLAMGMN